MKYFKKDTSSIDDTPARELAAEIIDSVPQLAELAGEPYFECEDLLTEIINNYFKQKEKRKGDK